MNIIEQQSRRKVLLGQDGNSLVFLLAANVILFILLSFVKVVFLVNDSTADAFRGQVFSWLTVPAQPLVLASRPWSLLTYMFAHFEFWDLFSSMCWLWAFGYILQNLTGNKKLIPVYIYGGLAGSITFFLLSNLVPAIRININSVYPLMGAGPAVMAVAIATTTLAPQYSIFPQLKFPLWAITLVFVIIRIGTVGAGNYGHAAAMVAGGFIGFIFAWQLQKGNDWGQWMSEMVNWVNDLLNPNKKRQAFSPKDEFFYKANQKPFEKIPHVTQQRVDELLDKINIKGYNSLTEEEKNFLKKASKEDL